MSRMDFMNRKNMPKKRFSFTRVLNTVFLLLMMMGFLDLFWEVWKVTRQDKAKALCRNAEWIYQWTEKWLEEDEEHILTTMTGNLVTGGEEGSLQSYLKEEWGDSQYVRWYAIVCDENGELEYTLFSHSSIQDLSMVSWEETLEMMSRPSFLRQDAVGGYAKEKGGGS